MQSAPELNSPYFHVYSSVRVYVWRQRGDHFIGHEELAETEEAARVERAAKRLVDEVKVSDFLY